LLLQTLAYGDQHFRMGDEIVRSDLTNPCFLFRVEDLGGG